MVVEITRPKAKETSNQPDERFKKPRMVEIVEDEDGEEFEVEIQPPKKVELPFKMVAPVEFAPREQKVVPLVRDRVIKNLAEEIAEDVAYRLRAPLDEIKAASSRAIVDSINKTLIPVPLGDLVAVAPDVQKEVKKMVTKRRVPVENTGRVHFQDEPEEIPDPEEEILLPGFSDPSTEQYVQVDAICTRDLPFAAQYFVSQRGDGLVPKGALIANDPVLQYHASLAKGEQPKQIFVAAEDQLSGKDSAGLRVVFPLIHSRAIEECIMDGGSQIVSMALETAIQIGLTWDPDINIFMQSANGQVEKTAGLARNVAFRFGELTVYLQVHVIKSPPYKVLLGRPFEILTASLVQNQTDGGQIITLTDPQSKNRCTFSTFERGHRKILQKSRSVSTEIPEDPPNPPAVEANFQRNSRN